MYLIYKITNTVNNKHYIGLTSKTAEQRFMQHINDAVQNRDNYAFHAAIRKYGYNVFELEVLEENLTEEQAKLREIYYIDFYNSFIGNGYGYNSTYGGDLNSHLRGENSSRAKLTEKDIEQIYNLLINTNMQMNQIALKLNLPIGEYYISDINKGKVWHKERYNYPLRKQSRTVSKQGQNNHSAKLNDETVLKIIDELLNTTTPQTQLASKYNVSYNTINGINRCKNWTHLHNYTKNIRDGI